MKQLLACLFVLLFGSFAHADVAGYKFDSLTVSSGENTTSSGITGVVDLTNNSKLIEIAVQQEQAWFIYGKKFKFGKVDFTAAGSVGHHQGAPWFGPFLLLEVPLAKHVSFSTMHWPGLYLWEPRDWKTENDGIENPETLLIGHLSSAQLNIGPLGLVYSMQNFLDTPWNKLPGVSYTQRIRKDFKVIGSATRNINAKRWMFYIGATWSPKEK